MSIVATHFFMAIFIGYLYWQVGQDAKRMEENAKMIFFNIMFLSFCALSSTVQSCKNKTEYQINFKSFIDACILLQSLKSCKF